MTSSQRIPAIARVRGLLSSEWTKIQSAQSTYFTLAAAAALTLTIGMVVTAVTVSDWDTLTPQVKQAFDPITASLNGLVLGQLAMATLGALVVTSEYSTGAIRTTLAAVPQRTAVVAAKATVLGAVALVAGEAIAFASFFAGQAVLHGRQLDISITAPHVLPAVLGAGFYMMVVGLVGLGLGTALRHTAGALGAAFTVLFLLPQIVHAMPTPWDDRLGKYMLPNAAQQIAAKIPSPAWFDRSTSYLLLISYVILALVAGTVVITRQDA